MMGGIKSLMAHSHLAGIPADRQLVPQTFQHLVAGRVTPSGAAAVKAVAVLRPEIVLLDIQLPDLDGLAVAEQLAGAPDPPAVVLISSRDAAAYGPRLQATPARGFIPKRGLSGEALAALTG